MLRKVFSLFVIVGVALVLTQTTLSSPAVAQASCMHCNFAQAKCKRFNPDSGDKCNVEKAACVKKCQATTGSTAGTSNRLKADELPKPKK